MRAVALNQSDDAVANRDKPCHDNACRDAAVAAHRIVAAGTKKFLHARTGRARAGSFKDDASDIAFLKSAYPVLRWFKRYNVTRFPEGRRKADVQFLATLELLKPNPFIGRPLDDIDAVRIHVIARTPFSFVYRIRADAVEVIRVLDGRSEDANDLL